MSIDESNGILLGDNLPDSEHPLRTALFDTEQEELFQRRFDEGYNLRTDPDYNRWLEINYPEVLPLSGHSLNQEASLSVLQPVSTDTNETTKLTPEVEDLESEFESSQIVTPDTRDKKSNSSSTPKSTRKSTPTLFSGSSACSSSNTSLSKFLDHTVLTTPTGEPARSHLPCAKLLTSMSFLAMLEEKEKKKQQALEEKEKNKRERGEEKEKARGIRKKGKSKRAKEEAEGRRKEKKSGGKGTEN